LKTKPKALQLSLAAVEILKNINIPQDLKHLDLNELIGLSQELKDFVLEKTSVKKGHIESSLTVTELTVALHYLLDTPRDALFWDVGHQAYIHKILTGRKSQFYTNRDKNGLSGFPHIEESDYDLFTTGHSSTSISAVAGIAIANRLSGNAAKHVAVIGDGALTGGMAFEALNYLGEHNEDVLIILNDNNSAIDKNVGGLSAHANYRDYFKSLGLNYLGETNGQNMMHLVPNLKTAIDEKGARVLRVITQGVKVPFSDSSSQLKGYTKSFIDKLSELARANENIVAVSPAMLSGSGLDVFKNEFPKRCFDVGIAEQHAVTMSAGLAKAGKTPICHLYSTFSQRGMDQIIHDVALQNLHVIFMLDRAGLVGSDGATHHGVFDVAMLSGIPNLQILAPASAAELSVMLEWAIDQNGPIIIRFPRTGGALPALHIPKEIHANRMEQLTIGNGEIAVLNFGFLLGEIQESLKEIAIDSVSLFNVRFAKSLSEIDLKQIAKHKVVWLIEDSQKRGGVGEYLAQQLFELGYQGQYFHSGLPDTFIEHGTMQELYAQHDLTHLAFTKKLKILIR
jgi:1-deoxy-D-xylulose-5-phosphate synthase